MPALELRSTLLLVGMLAGIVLAIAVYVVAIYFAVRERMYLYFAAFAGLNLVYQLHSEGYAYIL